MTKPAETEAIPDHTDEQSTLTDMPIFEDGKEVGHVVLEGDAAEDDTDGQ